MIRTVKVIIKGQVQGVGFRYFALQEAHEYEVKGYVKNMYDGSVEVIAQGDEPMVARYLTVLKTGPRFGYIQEFLTEEITTDQESNNFRVEYCIMVRSKIDTLKINATSENPIINNTHETICRANRAWPLPSCSWIGRHVYHQAAAALGPPVRSTRGWRQFITPPAFSG